VPRLGRPECSGGGSGGGGFDHRAGAIAMRASVMETPFYYSTSLNAGCTGLHSPGGKLGARPLPAPHLCDALVAAIDALNFFKCLVGAQLPHERHCELAHLCALWICRKASSHTLECLSTGRRTLQAACMAVNMQQRRQRRQRAGGSGGRRPAIVRAETHACCNLEALVERSDLPRATGVRRQRARRRLWCPEAQVRLHCTCSLEPPPCLASERLQQAAPRLRCGGPGLVAGGTVPAVFPQAELQHV